MSHRKFTVVSKWWYPYVSQEWLQDLQGIREKLWKVVEGIEWRLPHMVTLSPSPLPSVIIRQPWKQNKTPVNTPAQDLYRILQDSYKWYRYKKMIQELYRFCTVKMVPVADVVGEGILYRSGTASTQHPCAMLACQYLWIFMRYPALLTGTLPAPALWIQLWNQISLTAAKARQFSFLWASLSANIVVILLQEHTVSIPWINDNVSQLITNKIF